VIQSDSIPQTASVNAVKRISGWEIFWRCFLLLLGIFLGLVGAMVMALALGWLTIDC
jgi:hypothetical protein